MSHATDSEFTVFDKSKAGENTDSNATDENFAKTAHLGFWFNDGSPAQVSMQSKEMKVFLNIRSAYGPKSLDSLANDLDGTSQRILLNR